MKKKRNTSYIQSSKSDHVYWFPPGSASIEEETTIGGGWFFADEAGLLSGPYDSEQTAIDHLNDYARFLNDQSSQLG